MKARTKILLIILIISIFLSQSAPADLSKQIQSIIHHPSQKNVKFSIHVINASSGESVYSYNLNKALISASNTKLIVTAAALKYLGPEYVYTTKVGLCDDTLVIIGSGDPLLGDKVTDNKYEREQGWIFKDIIRTLKNNNIKAINNIIVDSSVFDDVLVHPHWPRKDLNRWYACEVSGINYNCNCVEIAAENTGNKITISIYPQTEYVKVINNVTAVEKGKMGIGAYRNQQPNTIIVRGRCKEQVGPIDVAIERPAAFFAFLLAENMTKAGIQATGKIIEKPFIDKYDFRPLVEYKTPIVECLIRSNKNSLGLAAEALLKTIAANNNPNKKNGTWDSGRDLISKYLIALDIDKDEFHIDDGSGLSRHNRLSANVITKTILNIYKSENWEVYKGSLAVGGVDGTISKYFKEQQYKGKIIGKTGYIRGVQSFSGLCCAKDGDYIFSILANNTNSKTRMAINDIVKEIIVSAGI